MNEPMFSLRHGPNGKVLRQLADPMAPQAAADKGDQRKSLIGPPRLRPAG